MKPMKSLARALLPLFGAMLLCVTASADSGPKDQLLVRVEKGPSEPYYLDLLEEGSAQDLHETLEPEELAALDPALLQRLLEAVPQGWHACLAQGVSGPPIHGSLTGEAGEHLFRYYGVPDTYRILLVTASGEVFLSPVCTRRVLQSSVTVDWPGRSVHVPPVWIGYVLQFFSTLLPTLLIEGLLLFLFGYGRQKRERQWFLAVNLLTQGLLAAVIAVQTLRHGVSGWTMLPFLGMEAVITALEAAVYPRVLRSHGTLRPVLYGATANLASALLGLYLVGPVWRAIVSIS